MALDDNAKLHLHVQVVGYAEAGGGDAQDTVLDLFFNRTTLGAAYSASAFTTAFHTAIKTKLKNCLSDQWSWIKTRVRVLNDPTEAWVETTVNENGAVTGDAAPSYVAAVIAKYSSFRGRKNQGRLFLGVLAEDSIVGNELEAAHVTVLNTLGTALKTAITDAGVNVWTPGILSRKDSRIKMADDPPTIAMVPWTLSTTRTVLARQSQRKSRVY